MKIRNSPGTMRQAISVLLILGPWCIQASAGSVRDSAVIKYQTPSPELLKVIDAPLSPAVSIDPTNRTMAILIPQGLPSLEELAQPELKLAGIRINPETNGPSRCFTFKGLYLLNIKTGRKICVDVPEETLRVKEISWSPDGKYLAFSIIKVNGIELWITEAGTGRAQKLTDGCLSAVLGKSFVWCPDSKNLLVKTIDVDRGAVPIAAKVPDGPNIQQNVSKSSPARTYADLLKNKHDELLFEFYTSSSILMLSIDGASHRIVKQGIIDYFDVSPDGKYVLIERYQKPFSYFLPYYRFPRQTELWDTSGNILKNLCSAPLQDQIPVSFGSVRNGPRDYSWRDDKPACLCWVEAQDGGDAGKEAAIRDKTFLLNAPFNDKPQVMASLQYRFENIIWANDSIAIVYESWWSNKKRSIWLVNPSEPSIRPLLLWDLSMEDRYNDPGYPVTSNNEYGKQTLRTKNNGCCIYLFGEGASSEGDRPFVDEYNMKTHRRKRIFQSNPPFLEYPIRLLEKGLLITSRESKTQPANYFLRSLGGSRVKPLTAFPNPTPEFEDVQKKVIHYKRSDGLDLMATLYLPNGYDQKTSGRLPLLIWAYPQAFTNIQAAGQVFDSPCRFVSINAWSPIVWTIRGYAVLDNPSMPIVTKEGSKPNENFVEQLIENVQAAINEAARIGIADTHRIAIGGHSYGAFMVANLLAHSRLFKAGIAESGAYNRTLTPFGFQTEDRTLWEARDIYCNMSPLMYANNIKDPILIIHGQADDNPGTIPIQSERFYDALRGNGASARLVTLPFESHMYVSRESVMHVLWEIDQWLKEWVLDNPAR